MKLLQYSDFARFHDFGLCRVDMVVALQMQHAVDGHVGVLMLRRLALFARLALDHRRADHDVAAEHAAP